MTLSICSKKLNAQETVEIRKALLDSIYAKVATISIYKQELDSTRFLLTKCVHSSELADSIISMQTTQVRLYREAIETFTKDLNKKKTWYNNVYVGVLLGASMVYLASEVVSNIERK